MQLAPSGSLKDTLEGAVRAAYPCSRAARHLSNGR